MKMDFIIFSFLIFIQHSAYLVAMEYTFGANKQEKESDDETIALVCNDKEINFPRSILDISGTFQEMCKDELVNDKDGKYYCLFSVNEVLLLKPLCNLIRYNNEKEIKKKLYNFTVDEMDIIICLADYFDISLLLMLAKDVMPIVSEEHNRKIALSLRTKKNLKKFIKNSGYIDTLMLSDSAQQQITQMLLDTSIFKQKIMQKIKILFLESYSITPPLESCAILCWRPHSKRKHIIWISNDWISKAWIWSEDLERWQNFSLDPSDISSIGWSTNGEYLVAGMNDGSIRIVHFDSDTCIRELQGHTTSVRAISCSADGKYIASGSSDCTLCIWDIHSGDCMYRFKPRHDDSSYYHIRSVCWSPNSKYLAVEINDGTVNIYDANKGKYILSLPNNQIRSISWSPDGKYLACGQHVIVGIWDIYSRNYIYKFGFDDTTVTIVKWSPNGKYLAVGTKSGAYIYELSTGELIFQTPKGEINGMSWDENGNYLVIVTADSFDIWNTQGINILDNIDLKQALLLEVLPIKKIKHIKKYNHLLDIIHSLPPLIKKIIDPHMLAPLKKTVGLNIALSTLLGGMGLSYSAEKTSQNV